MEIISFFYNVDVSIMNWVFGIRSETLTEIMLVFSFLGSGRFILTLTIFLTFILIYQKRRELAALLVALIIGQEIIVRGLKYLIGRTRPDIIWPLIAPEGYSFPSGHAFVAFSFYGAIIYFLWQKDLKREVKIIIAIILSLCILLIGFSRVYLGVHWPSDVASGFLGAYFWLRIMIFFQKKEISGKNIVLIAYL